MGLSLRFASRFLAWATGASMRTGNGGLSLRFIDSLGKFPARARKPDEPKLTGEVAAKSVPVSCGRFKTNALFSALTKVSRVVSKSNRSCMPPKGVVTPVAKTSMAILVPRPDTVPDVTAPFCRLPDPPSAPPRNGDAQGLVLSGEGICAEDVGVGDCVAEGREEGVEAFDVLREGADDEEVGLGRGEREQEVGRGWSQ